jgi:CRISPR-associated protein Cas5d
MLFDLKYRHDQAGKGVGGTPRFFEARIERGILKVPQELYKEVMPDAA